MGVAGVALLSCVYGIILTIKGIILFLYWSAIGQNVEATVESSYNPDKAGDISEENKVSAANQAPRAAFAFEFEGSMIRTEKVYPYKDRAEVPNAGTTVKAWYVPKSNKFTLRTTVTMTLLKGLTLSILGGVTVVIINWIVSR